MLALHCRIKNWHIQRLGWPGTLSPDLANLYLPLHGMFYCWGQNMSNYGLEHVSVENEINSSFAIVQHRMSLTTVEMRK